MSSTGALVYPAAWQAHFFGNQIVVNGKISPFTEVLTAKVRPQRARWCGTPHPRACAVPLPAAQRLRRAVPQPDLRRRQRRRLAAELPAGARRALASWDGSADADARAGRLRGRISQRADRAHLRPHRVRARCLNGGARLGEPCSRRARFRRPGERYEVVVDFSSVLIGTGAPPCGASCPRRPPVPARADVYLINSASAPYPGSSGVGASLAPASIHPPSSATRARAPRRSGVVPYVLRMSVTGDPASPSPSVPATLATGPLLPACPPRRPPSADGGRRCPERVLAPGAVRDRAVLCAL